MPNCCNTKLRKRIKAREDRTIKETKAGFKPLAQQMKIQQPNLYLLVQLGQLSAPDNHNLFKFQDAYPYFIKACNERNLAFGGDYVSFIASNDKIPSHTLDFFLKSAIPNNFRLNAPSPICKLNLDVQALSNTIFEQNPLLKTFQDKIHITKGKLNATRYLASSDTFAVTINSQECANHQIINLVHELGHVKFYLESFQKDIDPGTLGKYPNELQAIRFVHAQLDNLVPQLLPKVIAEEEKNKQLVRFEVSLYQDLPQTPPTKFTYESVSSPYLFLYYHRFVTHPLSQLSAVVVPKI